MDIYVGNLSRLKQQLDDDLFLVVMVIYWKLWDVRNNEVHGAEAHYLPDMVSWARVVV